MNTYKCFAVVVLCRQPKFKAYLGYQISLALRVKRLNNKCLRVKTIGSLLQIVNKHINTYIQINKIKTIIHYN